MLTLIAESKAMLSCDRNVERDEFLTHRPALETEADSIMESLLPMTSEQLAMAVKISQAMATRLRQMIREFPNKRSGLKAMEAFTGVVFKAADIRSLTAEAMEHVNANVRIISSLYGWLRPDDIVKQYRFDFTTPLAPEGKSFAAFWQNAVTGLLLHELQRRNEKTVLNLMPGDAARCIDWAAVSNCCRVIKADFREIAPGGTPRTPNSNMLKKLRGQLLRQIAQENIQQPEQLLSLTGNSYFTDPEASTDNTIVFITAQ